MGPRARTRSIPVGASPRPPRHIGPGPAEPEAAPGRGAGAGHIAHCTLGQGTRTLEFERSRTVHAYRVNTLAGE
eukprot:3826505-Prymnesium_polylepis.1